MKRQEQPVDVSGNVPFPDANWNKACPLVTEHLSHEYWDDGKPRSPSTLTVRCESGRINMALNDREAKSSLYVTADDVTAALKALEKALSSPGADWRKWSGGGGKKKA